MRVGDHACLLEVISFGGVGRLSVMVGIVERLVPDELWVLF
ncbi:hypothetical protein ABID95_008085, partial [Streptomyces atratus]